MAVSPNTFRGQIPNLPYFHSLFDIALTAADAYASDSFLHREAAETGKIPLRLRDPEFRGSELHSRMAEECMRLAGDLQGWASEVAVPSEALPPDEVEKLIRRDNDNTFRGQIPDIPGNLTLFEVALKAANAYGDEAVLHREAAVTGKIPRGLRYLEFCGRNAHLSRAESCLKKSGEIMTWALQVILPCDAITIEEHNQLARKAAARNSISFKHRNAWFKNTRVYMPATNAT